MRVRSFLPLMLLAIAFSASSAQQNFATNFAPTMSYSETYNNFVEPDGDGGYDLGVSSQLIIAGKCSMQGVDLTTIDELTEVTLSVQGLNFDDYLYSDPNFSAGDNHAIIPVYDSAGDPDPVGHMTLSWNQSVLNYSLAVKNDAYDWEVDAADAADSGDANPLFSDEPVVTMSFGDSSLPPTTLYISGTVAFNPNPKDATQQTGPLAAVHLTGFIDSTPPTNVVMTNPLPNAVVFQTPISLAGSAQDNVGIGGVMVTINGGAPITAAVLGNHWSLASVALKPGKNVIVVQATDQDGNVTTTKPLNVTYVIDPFAVVKGSYNGLVQSATPADNGAFSATVTGTGQFTGAIKIGALTIPIAGKLGADLKFTHVFTLKGGASYNVSLAAATTGLNGSAQISGTITGPNSLDATIMADVAAFKKKGNLMPSSLDAGAYNILLPAVTPNTGGVGTLPVGVGYGRAKISSKGVIRFVGKLGDGVVISFGSALSQSESWPFYASPSGYPGSIYGTVQLDRKNTTDDQEGALTWQKSAVGSTGAFTGSVDLTGVKWAPGRGARVFLNLAPAGSGMASLDAPASGGMAQLADDTIEVQVSSTNKVTFPSGGKVTKVTIKPTTGLFTGSFLDASNNPHTFSGAILCSIGKKPKVNAAAGLFLWGGTTGAVQITPPPSVN